MLSYLSKSAFKMASKDPKKILLKSTKNMKLSNFFSDLRGHSMPLYFIPVSVRVRLARTLLKRLLS